MRYTAFAVPSLMMSLVCGSYAQSAPKIGVIYMQQAIASTKDGQKASADLNAKFAPTREKLEKRQADIESDKAKLSQGANAMSVDQKEKLARDIEQKTKALNREAEDAQAEVDQETGKIMQDLGGRMMAVIQRYAKDKGFALILDVSSQQTPVLWAPDDITEEIIKLYDQNAAATAAAAPAATKPAATTPSPARPAATTPSPVRKTPAPPAK